MAAITESTLDVCPKCGTETQISYAVTGTRYVYGSWEDGKFLASEDEIETEDEGPTTVFCNSYTSDWETQVPDLEWEWE